MNNKGFTLVELLGTLVILAIVIGISIAATNFNLNNAKEKTEDVFVDTIRDALDIYITGKPSELKYNNVCSNKITKKHGDVKVYKAVYSVGGVERNIVFNDVINSKYKPINEGGLVNPANKDAVCNKNAVVNVYRDEDYVYYYSVLKSDFDCLLNDETKIKEEFDDGTKIYYSKDISNLPEGYVCG